MMNFEKQANVFEYAVKIELAKRSNGKVFKSTLCPACLNSGRAGGTAAALEKDNHSDFVLNEMDTIEDNHSAAALDEIGMKDNHKDAVDERMVEDIIRNNNHGEYEDEEHQQSSTKNNQEKYVNDEWFTLKFAINKMILFILIR